MISELRLRNFKCFAELDLPLRPLTVLTGVNSSGKSTILQALLLLRQSHDEGRLGADGSLVLNGELVSLGTPEMVVKEEESVMAIEIDWSDGGSGGFQYTLLLSGDAFALRTDAFPNAELYAARLPFNSCRYVGADRTGPRAAFIVPPASRRDEVGPQGEYAAHYIAEHGQDPLLLDALHHENARQKRLRPEVEAWLGMFATDVEIKAVLHAALDVCGLEFSFPGPTGRTKLQRSTHVGFGLTYALPIVVSILAAKSGDLVVIENPEAHLHPRAQAELADLLTRAAAAGVQVLVETHSDHVLNAIRVAVRRGRIAADDVAAHFFQHDAPQVVSPKFRSDGTLSEWPEGFFDQWDRALNDLLPGNA